MKHLSLYIKEYFLLIPFLVQTGINAGQKTDIMIADSLIKEAHSYMNHGNYEKAKEFVQKSVSIYNDLNLLYKKTESNILLAEILYYNDQFDRLENLFISIENEIKAYHNNDINLNIKYLYLKATYYRYIGNVEICTHLFQNIIELSSKISLEPAFRAKMYRQIGNYYLFTTSEYLKSIQMFDSALFYFHMAEYQPVEIFNCHWCLGQAFIFLKKYVQADLHLTKCEHMYMQSPYLFKILISYVYSYKMEIYGALNNEKLINIYQNKIEKAFHQYKDSIATPNEKNKFFLNYLLSFINQSDYYSKTGNYDQSLIILQKAEQEISTIPHLLQYIYDRMAWLYLKTGNYNKALYYGYNLLELQFKIYKKENVDFSDTYYLLSEIEKEKGCLNKQKEYIEKGLAIPNISKVLSIKLLTNLGISYKKEEKYDKALLYINKSLKTNIGSDEIDNLKNIDFENVIEKEFLLSAMFEKGCIMNEQSRKFYQGKKIRYIEEANQYYKLSIDQSMQYLISLESDFDFEYFLKEIRNKIKLYIVFLMNCYEKTNYSKYQELAFNYIEKSKAPVLNNSFIENESKITGNIPLYLIKQENELNKKISEISIALRDEKNQKEENSAYLNLLSDSLSFVKNQKEILRSYIEESYPSYFNLKYQPKIIDLDELKINLSKNQSLIEYFLADDLLFIIYISD